MYLFFICSAQLCALHFFKTNNNKIIAKQLIQQVITQNNNYICINAEYSQTKNLFNVNN